ncbi:hypothetical protein [Actinomadura madurae]|uniref:hypothetical protein n=1 Tax=Actinomadura madurae TaxID=1993 RepID=UPI0027E22848|nr:hypothetical protein [Actinomadura madurae]
MTRPLGDTMSVRPGGEGGEGVLDGGLVLGVERGGRLVEQTTGAFLSSARAMETRWRSPPDSTAPPFADAGVPAGARRPLAVDPLTPLKPPTPS